MVEALPPVLMFLSVIGLGIAWRWEKLGSLLAICIQFITLIVLAFSRPIGSDFPRTGVPYLISAIILFPGILFLFSWWNSRKIETFPAET